MVWGFTLIELLLVIAIIGLLTSITSTAIKGARERAKRATVLQFSAQLYHNLGAYAVGIWDFNEGTGGTVADPSGGGNDGTINGAIWRCANVDQDYTPNREGCSLEFDGVNDYVRVLDSPSLDITGDMTIEAWVKFYNVDGPEQSIVSKCEDYSSFALRLNQLNTGDRKVGMKIEDGIHNQFLIESTTLVKNNRWYHLVAVKVGTSLKLYLDSKLEPDILGGVSVAVNAYDLFIGGDPQGFPPGELNYPFNGIIDGVRIYNASLTTAQIKKLYVEGAVKRGLLFVKIPNW